MKALENMTIGRRIGLGFLTVLALLVATGALAVWHLGAVAESTRTMMNVPLAKERMVADWYRNIQVGVRRTTAIARSADPSLADFFAEETAAGSKATTELQSKIEPLLTTEREKTLFAQIATQRKAYLETRNAISSARESGNIDESTAIFEQKFLPASTAYLALVSELAQEQRESIDAMVRSIEADYHASVTLMLAVIALALGVGLTAAFVITRSLLKQLGGEPAYAAEIAGKIAAGDLAVEVRIKEGDCSSLLFAMKSMRDSLAGIVSRVRTGTDAIATAASQIAAGNLDLSSRTEQQAGSLEETASSMEELTSTVKQNADNARQANSLASEASNLAVEGGELVSKVTQTMESINTSSRRIVDIISVIDGIAFQTNILALNAAVEAARAGEQGRGFAVVAGEVRALARRSAEAAKEIKGLIDASVKDVDAGTSLVSQAGSKMEEIVDGVKRVTDIMGEIADASRDQSDGIEQVNRAVGQMDQVTQQNAALVEQAAAATEAMQEQAQKLVQVVGIFRLDNAAGPSVAQSAPGAVAVHRPDNVTLLAVKRPASPVPAKPAAARVQARRVANSRAGDSRDWEEF